MRKPIEVNLEVLKTAVSNAKEIKSRGKAVEQITAEYIDKSGKKVCLMWVRKRLIDNGLFTELARSNRGRKLKV
jgi:hypothetical protein